MARDWRYHTAIEPVAITDDDTDQLDLPSEGVISKAEIIISNTNAADIEIQNWRRLAAHITNITITGDTNDIIHDMNAMQSRGFAMDTEQKIPPEEHRGYNDAPQNTVIPIYFGRYARDENYGLDLSKWTNVRLSITNDFSDDHFLSGYGEVAVRLLWTFNPDISPAMYLAKTTMDEQAVPTADRWARPIILPVRYPIRRIGIEGYIPTLKTDTHLGEPKATLAESIEEIKLWKQARKDLIWDDSLAELFRFNEDEYGHGLLECYLDHSDNSNGLWTDTTLGRLDVVTDQIYSAQIDATTPIVKVSKEDWERHHALLAWPSKANSVSGLMAYGRGYNSMGFFRFYSWTPREIFGDTDEEWLHPGAGGDGVCELMYMIGDTDVQARTHIEQAIDHPSG